MGNRCLFLLALILVLSAAGCGRPEEDAAPIDEADLVRARVGMHGNRVCEQGPGEAAALADRFRLKRITITDATLQTFPDRLGPVLNPGGPLENYCWWVTGADCPASWYGDERIEFPAGSDLEAEAASRGLAGRCGRWLEDEAGVDVDDVVAVSLYQDGWMSMGFEGFDDGSYPVYVCLVPSGLLQGRQQARVASCTLTVLAATEAGDTNTVFGHVESLEFGL